MSCFLFRFARPFAQRNSRPHWRTAPIIHFGAKAENDDDHSTGADPVSRCCWRFCSVLSKSGGQKYGEKTCAQNVEKLAQFIKIFEHNVPRQISLSSKLQRKYFIFNCFCQFLAIIYSHINLFYIMVRMCVCILYTAIKSMLNTLRQQQQNALLVFVDLDAHPVDYGDGSVASSAGGQSAGHHQSGGGGSTRGMSVRHNASSRLDLGRSESIVVRVEWAKKNIGGGEKAMMMIWGSFTELHGKLRVEPFTFSFYIKSVFFSFSWSNAGQSCTPWGCADHSGRNWPERAAAAKTRKTEGAAEAGSEHTATAAATTVKTTTTAKGGFLTLLYNRNKHISREFCGGY